MLVSLRQQITSGKSLKDLSKLIRDRGMVVADVIAHAEWIVEDETRRRKGFEEAKRIMGICQEIGSPHVAAPPQGAAVFLLQHLFEPPGWVFRLFAVLCHVAVMLGLVIVGWRHFGDASAGMAAAGSRAPAAAPASRPRSSA